MFNYSVMSKNTRGGVMNRRNMVLNGFFFCKEIRKSAQENCERHTQETGNTAKIHRKDALEGSKNLYDFFLNLFAGIVADPLLLLSHQPAANLDKLKPD